jgi:anhydro-N-acetylmuramic acid kinase
MAVKLSMRVLGFMTGTSLDAVDMAVVETDGEHVIALGPAGEKKLDPAVRATIECAIAAAKGWEGAAPAPPAFETASAAIAAEHLAAARGFLLESGLKAADLDLVGVHGQTVLHEAPGQGGIGRSVQLIDAKALAEGLGLPVVYDFRAADIAAGGQGAPLAPVYHRALAVWSKLPLPVAVLNLGGVANVTFIGADGSMTAFDSGPANGMIDLMVQARASMRCDEDGALARAGEIDQAVLESYLGHPYFHTKGPRSLDRFDFPLEPVGGLSIPDAAATLTAFAAETVARALREAKEHPNLLVVCGGGRRNPVLMEEIRSRVGIRTAPAETVGWRGDSIEAEAFAFLSARTVLGLPISFPETTGAPVPLTGGRIARPKETGRAL